MLRQLLRPAVRGMVACLVAAPAGHAQGGAPELVLLEDVQLTASSPAGGILTIVSGKGFARQYRWEGCVVDARLHARTSRWLGQLGIYSATAGRWAQPSDAACPERIHMPVGESQMHFADVASAEAWLRRLSRERTSWTDDGLVVSFVASRTPPQQQPAMRGLSADVWMICIDGRRPAGLPGATNAAIKVVAPGKGAGTTQVCAPAGVQAIAETQRALTKYWDDWDRQLRGMKLREQWQRNSGRS